MVSDTILMAAAIIAAFQSALRFAVVSDAALIVASSLAPRSVSIRFEVRGGFRLGIQLLLAVGFAVSIRFEVRGGFRQSTQKV